MKRSKFEGSTVVYKYGCPHWADLDDEGMNQLRLANNLWNELVDIERKADETVKTTETQAVIALAEADAVIEAAAERVSELKKRLKQERMHDRTTKPRASTKAELQMARTTLQVAKERRKAVREDAKEARQAIRSEVNATKKTEIGKEMYRTWTEKGLGWGTYNDVRDRVDTARKSIIHRRSEGEPAEFKFHHWNGEGTLHVQNQQMAGKERRVEWEILGDHPKHKTLRLRIGRARGMDAHTLEIPFVYKRPLPCSPQDVTDVEIKREVVAGKSRITIHFSCRVPAVQPRQNGASVWIRLVWKSEARGIRVGDITTHDVCVARIASSDPLPPVPKDLTRIIRAFGSRHADVVLPADYIWPLKRDDHIKSVRDRMLDGLRPHVVAAMDDPAIREVIKGNPAHWKAQAQFAVLARCIPPSHPLAEILAVWYKEDLHLWQYERHEQDQTIARRRDTYRKVAAWLAREALVFGLLEADYSEIKQRPNESEDSYGKRGGRKALQRVAPGELRLFINQAAAKNGIQVMQLPERGGADGDDGVVRANRTNSAGDVSDTEHLGIVAGTGD